MAVKSGCTWAQSRAEGTQEPEPAGGNTEEVPVRLTSYWGEAGLTGTEWVWQEMGTSSWEFSWDVGRAVVQPEQRWEAGWLPALLKSAP